MPGEETELEDKPETGGKEFEIGCGDGDSGNGRSERIRASATVETTRPDTAEEAS